MTAAWAIHGPQGHVAHGFVPDEEPDTVEEKLLVVPEWVDHNRHIGEILRASQEYTKDQPTPAVVELVRKLDPKATILWNNRTQRYEIVVYEDHYLATGPVDELGGGLLRMLMQIPVPVLTFQKAEDKSFLYPTHAHERAIRFALVRSKAKYLREQKQQKAEKQAKQDKTNDAAVASIESRLIPAWQREREEKRPAFSGLAVTTGTGPTHSSRFFGAPFLRPEAT